jgi:H+/Cl- antiporter ClcA
MGWCIVIAGTAAFITINIGPGAMGSGVPELMAYLNGVNYPKLISFQTFIVKTICVILAITTNLFIGKEGPLAHIGANIGVLVIYYMPIKVFQYFQNDVSKREFVAAGISAGVSAAFGAPIGGCLFSYELSKPTTFWNFDMLWRTFFCSAVSTFTVSTL